MLFGQIFIAATADVEVTITIAIAISSFKQSHNSTEITNSGVRKVSILHQVMVERALLPVAGDWPAVDAVYLFISTSATFKANCFAVPLP